MNTPVFYPHAAWREKRVTLPGQESRERKKARGSRRGKGRERELRLFSHCGGRVTTSRFWADLSIWVISAGRCGWEIWKGLRKNQNG